MNRLKVKEIFYSLQGESNRIGLPTVFIRLSGCPLRCQYCDTRYAFKGGDNYSIEQILIRIKAYQCHRITVTGGEPLAQKGSLELMQVLADSGYDISLETSGALPIDKVDKRVSVIMDIKTPTSKEANKNHWLNLNYIQSKDQIKFVLCNRLDYEWSKDIIEQYDLLSKGCELLFSPTEQLPARQLADWILKDHLPVRFQIQLHKLLWGNQPGR